MIDTSNAPLVKRVINKPEDRSTPMSYLGGTSTDNEKQSKMTGQSPKSSKSHKPPSKKISTNVLSKKDKEQFDQMLADI